MFCLFMTFKYIKPIADQILWLSVCFAMNGADLQLRHAHTEELGTSLGDDGGGEPGRQVKMLMVKEHI